MKSLKTSNPSCRVSPLLSSMAEIQNQPHKPKPQRSCFLPCFRFSGEVPDPDDTNFPSSRRKIRWFSRTRFRMKKSGTKTVPLEAPIPEKSNLSTEIEPVDSGEITDKRQIPATLVVASDQSVKLKARKTKHGIVQSTILEIRKPLDHVTPVEGDTCHQQLPIHRKTESKIAGGSQPGSPGNNPKSSKKLMFTLAPSFPLATAHPSRRSRLVGEKSGRRNDTLAGKLDPIVGMSILMVTLAIMLLWGRLCAIVCTSVCFYFVPRLRIAGKSDVNRDNRSESGDSGLNSVECKKKVVLEGFLERNRRNTIGIL
ncbi:hypothetical protein HHK36_006578 [Tetracentron sinense]|uniref:Uncharacterized protein n=1 Tax=Tetracentron sinense TaxID=13715 RepID=A0A834ZKT4_TETSI|nr:hypothetical protein HHK36_006578 [Tetracentron sinense]